MRRTSATLSLVLLLLSLTALAGASTWTVADDFSSGGYSGSTGSQDWPGNWTEVGEADGAGQGNVQVTSSGCSGSCLRIAPLLTLAAVGAARQVDLSDATKAVLSYSIDFPSGLLVVGRAEVAARIDGGAWATLKSHAPGTEDPFDVALPVGGQVTIRLQAADVSLASEMMWDDIVIAYDVPDVTTTTASTTTTTTTTTAPLPTLTVPTVTVPTVTLLTTTTTATTSTTPSTTSTPSTTTTTSATTARPPTTTRPTTTTTAPGVTTTTPTGAPTTTVPPTSTNQPPPTVPDDPADDLTASAPPSQTFGVITGIEPGLTAPALDIAAQRGFVVDFLLSAEDIRLDLVANLVVGLVLAWLSVKSLDRRQP